MSYCHLLSGGMSNVSFTFGEGHSFGTMPERVGQRLGNRVHPDCGPTQLMLLDATGEIGFAESDGSGLRISDFWFPILGPDRNPEAPRQLISQTMER